MWSKGFECGAYEYWVRHEKEMFEKGFVAGFEKGFVAGFEKGCAEVKSSVAIKLHNLENYDKEKIARILTMTASEVESILKKTEL